MPNQNSNSNPPKSNTTNPFIQALLGSFNPAQPSTTQPQQSPSQSAPSAMVRVGDQYLNLDPNQLASMKVDPNADMAAILKYMPQLNSGPYSSTPQGEGVTQSQYQQQLNSPFVSPLAQRLGKTHPRLAAILDGAMMGASGAETSHENALRAGGGVEGIGGGIADAISGGLSVPQQQLAHRQELQNLQTGYEKEQAGLQETQAGTLQHLLGALSEYESNPAKILSQYGRNYLSSQIGANSRQNIAQMNDAEKFQQSLNSDATKAAIEQLKSRVQGAKVDQLAHYRASFVQGLNGQVGAINARYDKMESAPVVDANGFSRQRSADEIAQMESQRQQEIEAEMAFGEHASRNVFGKGLLDSLEDHATTQPAPSPRTTRTPKAAPRGVTVPAGQSIIYDPQGQPHAVSTKLLPQYLKSPAYKGWRQ